MTVKPRKQILLRSDDHVIVHAGLFLVCAMLSALGMGSMALLCFLPAAALFEGLAALSPGKPSRRM